MKERRTIAIAGLGTAARNLHLPAYRKISQLQVVGACDPAVARGDDRYEFPVFPDVEALISELQPDILTIATPTPDHFELAVAGLQAGCHIFCEKPFTTTLDEAQELVQIASRAGRWIVVNNQFRFMDTYQAARRAIGSREFGDLLFVAASQTFFVDATTEAGWRGQDPQRTCKEFGIHVLDLCRFFFEQEPELISARMQRPEGPGGADYLNLITLEFPGGRLAQITLDRLTRGRHRYLDLRLDGTEAVIETEFGGQLEASTGIRARDRQPFVRLDYSAGGAAVIYHGEKRKQLARNPLNPFADATRKLMLAFLDALDRGTVPPCHARDNIKTLVLMLSAYESDRTGQPVALAEQWADLA
jgi:predicted dehydrogenase